MISHDSLDQATISKVPKFRFEGQIYSVNCAFGEAFDGFIMKKNSELEIKSIEI